ncbi:MAG: helix-turn-helix transcriptional regulator [Actinomycetota bacterium]|nr:helix-turn-helix transcriptional regulator [Actinomycetota bacterium]
MSGSSRRSGSAPRYPGLEQLGEFIKAQRKLMELSQRQLAQLTQLSDPYVSQLERGLHEPSVRVLKALASALNVRAETLLSYAGLLDEADDAGSTVVEAIQADPYLSDEQKIALLGVYRNFRGDAD